LESPLLSVKFFHPVLNPRLVQRSGLVERLNSGLESGHWLTLVSAPAGYGKSTLVAGWISQLGFPSAWLTLDEADDDPARFLKYLVAALQQVCGPCGQEFLGLLAAGSLPPHETLVTSLVNDLSNLSQPFALVLDNLQVIQDPWIHEFLSRWVLHRPPNLIMALTTREDPLLPLARLRANNCLTEVRAADLCFSESEAAALLTGMMGLDLAASDVSKLNGRTEGWVAGLQLAGLSLQGRGNPGAFVDSLSGSHRFILGYLTEEVLGCQPASIQDFLLETAILSHLHGDLCDAVTGGDHSAEVLEGLLAANLFIIPLDDEQQWYRYHHLFADLLRAQLQRTRPELVNTLHDRASLWYEEHGFPEEAIDHAVAAKNFERAVPLLENNIWRWINQGSMRRVEGWMKDIPPEWQIKSPRANLGLAWVHLLRGHFSQIDPYLEKVNASLALLDAAAPETLEMRTESMALRSNLRQVQGRLEESIALAEQVLALTHPDNLKLRGFAFLSLGGAFRQQSRFPEAREAYLQAIAVCRASDNLVSEILALSGLTLMCVHHGHLRFAIETASDTVARLESSCQTPPPIIGAIYGAMGLIYYEWNELETARMYLQRGLQTGVYSGHNASIVYSRVAMARLQQGEGDLTGAAENLADAAQQYRRGAPLWTLADLISQQVSLSLAQNRPAAAEAALKESRITAQDEITPQNERILLAHLRLLLYQGRSGQKERLQEGLKLADRLTAAAESGQREGILLQVLVLEAQLRAAAGDLSGGRQTMEQAVTIAQGEGYRRIFLDEGAPVMELLQKVQGEGAAAYARELLGLFRTPSDLPSASQGELLEPLTERESEVLTLLAQGLKYADIAERLVVSVNTVRYHVKGIYGKLGVEKQTQAVEKARMLGLL